MTEPVSSGPDLRYASSPLGWLMNLLWPEGSGSTAAMSRGGRPPSNSRAWAVMPSAARPTVLTPVSGRAASSALRQYNDSMSQPARLRKAAAGAAVRLGGGAFVARDRLVVTSSGSGSIDLIDDALPEILGRSRVEVAISVGRQLRPNLKPVLQIMDPDGRVLAYAKIGWNDLTKALVQNEARALRAWADAPPRHLEVPRLIHEGEWHGAAVTVLSPHPHRLFRRGSRNTLPSAAVIGEVAALGGTERSSLAASSYWRALTARVEGIAAAEALRSVLGRLEATSGDEELAFGSCHGDWAPWNMSRGRRTLYVWDWERSVRPTPVGTDALHFWFEVGFHKEGMDVATASRSALARSNDTFDGLQIARSPRPVLLQLFLLERFLRLEEGRTAGVPVNRDLADGLLRELGEG